MSQQYYVYILSNYVRTVLYTGVTRNLLRRVYEHKQNLVKGFTEKYKAHYLMHYEVFHDPQSAIEREKQIKSWSRRKKDSLIAKMNPNKVDLYDSLLE